MSGGSFEYVCSICGKPYNPGQDGRWRLGLDWEHHCYLKHPADRVDIFKETGKAVTKDEYIMILQIKLGYMRQEVSDLNAELRSHYPRFTGEG